MEGLYIKAEVYDKKKTEIINQLRELQVKGVLNYSQLVPIVTALFSMTDDGLIGGYEVFKEFRDKIEGDRYIW